MAEMALDVAKSGSRRKNAKWSYGGAYATRARHNLVQKAPLPPKIGLPPSKSGKKVGYREGKNGKKGGSECGFGSRVGYMLLIPEALAVMQGLVAGTELEQILHWYD